MLTRKRFNPRSLKEPRGAVPPIIVELELLVALIALVERVPPDTYAHVGRHVGAVFVVLAAVIGCADL